MILTYFNWSYFWRFLFAPHSTPWESDDIGMIRAIDSGASDFHDANHSEYILTSSYIIIPIIAHQFLSNQHVSASRWSLQDSAYRMPQLFCHRTFSWGAFHRSHHRRATLQTARDGGKQLGLGQKVQTQRHLWWHMVSHMTHISPYTFTIFRDAT